MIVLSRGIDNYFRLKFFQYGKHQVVKGKKNPFIRCPRRQRYIQGCSLCQRAAGFIGKAAAGIKGAPVLMKGYKQYIGVMPVNILRSVSVVDVCINNGNALQAVFLT